MAPKAFLIFVFTCGIISPGSASFVCVKGGFEHELNWSSEGSSSATDRVPGDHELLLNLIASN